MPDEETRGERDFIILKDEEQKTSKLIHVDDLIQKLHRKSLSGNLYQDKILPGMDKSRHFQHTVADSNFIICIIDGDNISDQYISQIRDSHHIKIRQKDDDRIIPVYTDPEHESSITTRYPQLMFIKLYEATNISELDWMDRIIKRMTTPSLGQLLLSDNTCLEIRKEYRNGQSCNSTRRSDCCYALTLSIPVPIFRQRFLSCLINI